MIPDISDLDKFIQDTDLPDQIKEALVAGVRLELRDAIPSEFEQLVKKYSELSTNEN